MAFPAAVRVAVLGWPVPGSYRELSWRIWTLADSVTQGKRVTAGNGNGRLEVPVISFAHLDTVMSMPNLLDVQRKAFDALLETGADEEAERDFGLERVFNEIFPSSDANQNFTLEFVSYSIGEPKYSVDECMERDMTYAAPLKATLRLVIWEQPEEDEEAKRDDIIRALKALVQKTGPNDLLYFHFWASLRGTLSPGVFRRCAFRHLVVHGWAFLTAISKGVM